MATLRLRESGRRIGKVSESELEFLMGEFERSTRAQPLYIDNDSLDMLANAGAPESLIAMLRAEVGSREGIEIVVEDAPLVSSVPARAIQHDNDEFDDASVVIAGKALSCVVCGGLGFTRRRAQLTLSALPPDTVEPTDTVADCNVCVDCGYVHFFLARE